MVGGSSKGAWKRLGALEAMRSSLKEVVLILHYTEDEEALTAGTFWRSIYARVFGDVILLAPTPHLERGISAVSAPPHSNCAPTALNRQP